MGKIFVTGDKHADFHSPDDYLKVKKFCDTAHTSKEDFLIVLGDHGLRYFDDWKDYHSKKKLAKYPLRFIMLRGNHDKRSSASWKRVYLDESYIRGWFVEDPEYPDILYTEEYGWYEFGGQRVFVINGAYSVDKWYRIGMNRSGYTNYLWFVDEQLSDVERINAQALLYREMDKGPFAIMSHTCPLTFKPHEKLLAGVDQDTVDETMEKWMDELYDTILKENKDNLTTWYCGHWHIDKLNYPVRFMYHDIIEL